jgi:hypothetical protein
LVTRKGNPIERGKFVAADLPTASGLGHNRDDCVALVILRWGFFMADFEILRRLAGAAAVTETEADHAREARDFSEGEPGFLETGRTGHPVRALVSPEARLKVIEFEVTSEQVYRRKYEKPILPGVSSGITIGIGYDLGYNDPASVARDLDGLIPSTDIQVLSSVCRLKGAAARPRLGDVRHIGVPWEAAIEIYRRATEPRFGRSVLATFPNAAELKGHGFGALLSLVYNRGPDLIGKPGDGGRRREMMAIHDLMKDRRFADIPAQFRAMKRIWQGDPNATGVIKRREAEALLFERCGRPPQRGRA